MKKLLFPAPQHLREEGARLILGIAGEARYFITDKINSGAPCVIKAQSRIKDRLASLINCPPAQDGIEIVLEMGKAPAEVQNPEQGYSIISNNGKITVTGFGDLGFSYASVTFCELLGTEENLMVFPSVELLDYPGFSTRSFFIESRYGTPQMTLDEWKEIIDRAVELKMNKVNVSLYGCWCVQYDGRVSEHLYVPVKNYPLLKTPIVERYFSPTEKKWVDKEILPKIFEEDFFGELVRYGRENGVEVFPFFNSYGHNTLIPAKYPEVSAKTEDGEPTLTGFCTSNPKTYELIFDVYDEIIDRYLKPNGVDSFVIGLDEVSAGSVGQNAEDPKRKRSAFCKCRECSARDNLELYMDHAVKLIRHLKEKGMKNVYMCDDVLRNKEPLAEGEMSKLARFREKLKENDLLDTAVIDFWCYSPTWEEMRITSTQPDVKMRKTVKPWNGYYFWTIVIPAASNIQIMADMGRREGAEGIITYMSWYRGYRRNDTAIAAYSWNCAGTGTPEAFADSYARSAFPDNYPEAKRAFSLMDGIYQVSKVKVEGEKYASLLNFLISVLPFYFYTYVNAKLPYPRIFPGEALKKIVHDRAAFEDKFYEIAAMSGEASAIFKKLSEKTDGDFSYAAQMVYEVENIRTLVCDYTALLEMYDITQSVKPLCADAVKRIRTLAGERKRARLSLMAMFEKVGEPYMVSSTLRNHSVFMQYFADLEGYLAETPVKKVKLDFFDNTHFASRAFNDLK